MRVRNIVWALLLLVPGALMANFEANGQDQDDAKIAMHNDLTQIEC